MEGCAREAFFRRTHLDNYRQSDWRKGWWVCDCDCHRGHWNVWRSPLTEEKHWWTRSWALPPRWTVSVLSTVIRLPCWSPHCCFLYWPLLWTVSSPLPCCHPGSLGQSLGTPEILGRTGQKEWEGESSDGHWVSIGQQSTTEIMTVWFTLKCCWYSTVINKCHLFSVQVIILNRKPIIGPVIWHTCTLVFLKKGTSFTGIHPLRRQNPDTVSHCSHTFLLLSATGEKC